MLVKLTTRRLGQALPRGLRRVDQAAFASRYLSTSYSSPDAIPQSSTTANGYRSVTLPFRNVRHFATDRPASRPKAHTGRSTSTTRKPASASKTPKAKTAKPKKAKAAKTTKPKRAKKPLTPEQKQRVRIKELRALALRVPKQLPSTAYTVLTTQTSSQTAKTEGIAVASKQASQRYKNLSASERENYNHIAQENKAKNAEAYKQWVRSIPAVDVYRANVARRQLSRLEVKGYSRRIQDDRQIKRPKNPRMFFLQERFATGEMAGIKAPDALKLITTEWHALPQPEKQKYIDAAAADHSRFEKDYQQLFGKPYTPKRAPSTP